MEAQKSEEPAEISRKKSTWIIHPFLFAIFPIARLYAANPNSTTVTDLAAPIAISIAATCVVWTLFAWILKSAARGAAVASALVVMFFAFDSIRVMLPSGTSDGLVTTAWVFAACLCAGLAGYKWNRAPTAFLNVMSFALLAMFGWRVASDLQLAFTKIPRWSYFFGRTRPGRPDIYYIILDGYGRSDGLRKYVGVDNSNFIDSLRKRGFYVADKAHSNYCQTEQSLTSSLNMNFLPQVVGDVSPDSTDRTVLDSAIDQNRVADFLKKHGYRYVAITTGFPGVNPESADLHLPKSLKVTSFDSALLDASPIAKSKDVLDALRENRRGLILSAVHTMPKVVDDYDEPCFVFVHILAPHPPFVFAADGTPAIQPRMPFAYADGDDYVRLGGTPAAYRDGYAGQAEYVSQLVSKAVDQILSVSGPKPVVIIQGDHGPKSHFKQNDLLETDPNEVFANLNAYYVPKEVQKELYPSITPVNTFRTMFRVMFKADLPDLPDRSYYSTWNAPFQYTDVTKELKW